MIPLSVPLMIFGHWQRISQILKMCKAERSVSRCVRETLQESYKHGYTAGRIRRQNCQHGQIQEPGVFWVDKDRLNETG